MKHLKKVRKLNSETVVLDVMKVDSGLRMGWVAVDSIHLYASFIS